jgi:predicted alpha/beta hydrolase family esterase
MHPILLVPGYQNSGPGHWQSLWEATMPGARRVEMPNWEHPHREAWVEALDDAVLHAIHEGAPPLLVAHSLGCLAVVHWARRHQRPVHGALLVAPPDVEREDTLEVLKEFAPIPLFALPFPARLVASSDDPHASIERSRFWADAWRTSFTDIGPRGHINGASGFGEWPRGEALLAEMI